MTGAVRLNEEFSADRETASRSAAEKIAAAVRRRLANEPRATLVVSGGTTPLRSLELLADSGLDWSKLTVTLSDERWVPSGEEASNERMVRETLLRGEAAAASFLPLYREGVPADLACGQIEPDLRSLPRPFACSLIGMGEDGHFASLFPDFAGLAEALDATNERLCAPVKTAASPHERLSLTLSALLGSDEIVLLIFGVAKRRVYEAARSGDRRYPITALLRQAGERLRVLWAP